jgi:hypothetical protein
LSLRARINRSHVRSCHQAAAAALEYDAAQFAA